MADGTVKPSLYDYPMLVLNTIRFYDRALTYDEIMYNYGIDQERFGL